MPTYDYVCRSCGHAFEQFQSMSEEPQKRCPKCGRDALERLIGAGAGFLFKGSGFYQTDYKRPAEPKAGAPAKSAAPATPPAAPKSPAAPDKGSPGSGAGQPPAGPAKGPAKSD